MDEFLAGLLVDDIFKTIVTVIASALGGYVIGLLTRFSKRSKAMATILKCTARNDIRDYYERHVVHGEKLTEARYNEIVDEFSAYEALGGNGHATKQYMEGITSITPWMVID